MTSNHPISNLLIRLITPLQCVPLYWKRLCPIIIPMAQMCLHVHSMPQKLLTEWTMQSYSIFSQKGICQVWLYDYCMIHTADNLCIRDGTVLCPTPYPWKMGSSRGVYCPRYFFVYVLMNYWNVLSAQGLVAILVITSMEGWAMRTMLYYQALPYVNCSYWLIHVKNSLLSTTLHLTQERLCVLTLGHGIS